MQIGLRNKRQKYILIISSWMSSDAIKSAAQTIYLSLVQFLSKMFFKKHLHTLCVVHNGE